MINDVEHLCTSVCLLWKNVNSFCNRTVWGFWYWVYEPFVYFCKVTPYWSYHWNDFSHGVGCLFVLSMVSFAVQELLHLIRFRLFIFAFVSFALGDGSKKILLWFMSKSILPGFSSRSFMVSGVTPRSLIHFEFLFVYSVRKCSNLILLHVAVQFSHGVLSFLWF